MNMISLVFHCTIIYSELNIEIKINHPEDTDLVKHIITRSTYYFSDGNAIEEDSIKKRFPGLCHLFKIDDKTSKIYYRLIDTCYTVNDRERIKLYFSDGQIWYLEMVIFHDQGNLTFDCSNFKISNCVQTKHLKTKIPKTEV